jgi:hypothetical protein
VALGDPYITRVQLKSYLKIVDTDDDAQLDVAVADISRGIEDYTGRQFNTASGVTARVYEPRRDGCLLVDDFSTTTGLVVAADTSGDGTYATTLTASQYELRPLNGIVRGQTGWPYWEIWPVNYSWPSSWVRAPLRVTALWGWAAVPAPVTQAAYILANDTFGLRTARFGVAGFDNFGAVRVGTNKRAVDKLAPYRLNAVMVA